MLQKSMMIAGVAVAALTLTACPPADEPPPPAPIQTQPPPATAPPQQPAPVDPMVTDTPGMQQDTPGMQQPGAPGTTGAPQPPGS